MTNGRRVGWNTGKLEVDIVCLQLTRNIYQQEQTVEEMENRKTKGVRRRMGTFINVGMPLFKPVFGCIVKLRNK